MNLSDAKKVLEEEKDFDNTGIAKSIVSYLTGENGEGR
jgi:hypothetical protein